MPIASAIAREVRIDEFVLGIEEARRRISISTKPSVPLFSTITFTGSFV